MLGWPTGTPLAKVSKKGPSAVFSSVLIKLNYDLILRRGHVKILKRLSLSLSAEF